MTDERFKILTPLGFSVRTSQQYWSKLVVKHSDLPEIEPLIRQALSNPDEIRRSSRDPSIILFYCSIKTQRWAVAVTRQLNGDGFLITAYQTDAIKEGEKAMARLKVFYEPEMELLTIFWQEPSENQLCQELGDGIILIKDSTTGEAIGIELLSYRPGDDRFDSVSVEIGNGQFSQPKELSPI